MPLGKDLAPAAHLGVEGWSGHAGGGVSKSDRSSKAPRGRPVTFPLLALQKSIGDNLGDTPFIKGFSLVAGFAVYSS